MRAYGKSKGRHHDSSRRTNCHRIIRPAHEGKPAGQPSQPYDNSAFVQQSDYWRQLRQPSEQPEALTPGIAFLISIAAQEAENSPSNTAINQV